MMKPSSKIPLDVLLVDDDANISRTLTLSLRDLECTVVQSSTVRDALQKLEDRTFDLVLTDFRMQGQTGLDLVREAKKKDPSLLLVVMTAFASFENAVAVVREGAYDYLPKPFTVTQLSILLDRIRLLTGLKRENRELKQIGSRKDYFAGFTSPAIKRLEEFISKVAPTEATVLLVGESGTGKSELARLVHEWSPRSAHPFVTVQCTSLAETLMESELFGHVKGAFTGATQDKRGKLELAGGGTLFLDEIGDLPLSGQSKLLRFLQEKVFEHVGGNQEISVDTRIIAATNKNLEEAVQNGSFRDDLYYRLNILECNLVPLRFRREDIPVLIQRIFKDLRKTYQGSAIPEGVMKALLNYSWPGNIRELRNVLERLLMLAQGREIEINDLPESVFRPEVLKTNRAIISLEQLEREHIEFVLSQETNLERVAEILGITTVTLWRKRKQFGLN
jgi:DNA-binding NtrC family response regulator